MNEATQVKGIMAAFIAVFTYLYNCFNVLLVVLAILMMSDYFWGLVVMFVKGEKFEVRKGVQGALKKLGYVFIIMFAFLTDYTITYLAQHTGVQFSTNGTIGIAITSYFVGTEGLSNLKHFAFLGLPIPNVLKKAFGMLKDSTEVISGIEIEGDEE